MIMAGEKNSKYKPEYDELVYNYCLLGATDKRIADFFDVTEQTVNNWKNDHPSFFESMSAGKIQADAVVARALFKRATGYIGKKTVTASFQGEIGDIQEVDEHIQPDITAIMFWLRNRQPEVWRNNPEPTDDDGGEKKAFNITFNVREPVNIEEVMNEPQAKPE